MSYCASLLHRGSQSWNTPLTKFCFLLTMRHKYDFIVILILPLVARLLSLILSWTKGDSHRSSFSFQTWVLSVLCIMSDVQLSFFSDTFAYISGIIFKFLFQPFATIPVAPDFTGTITNFVFHIRFIFRYTLTHVFYLLLCFLVPNIPLWWYYHIYQYIYIYVPFLFSS